MKRTATSCALAAAALLVGACTTPKREGDTTILSHCDHDRVSTGGYWWTYIDQAKGAGATITPLTDLTTSFRMEEGGYQGKCAHVIGNVTGPFPDTPEQPKDLCGERLYPAAGMGFGFLPNNVAYTITAEKLGVSFFAKATPNAPDTSYAVRVAMPQTTTDYPRAEFNDQFTKTCLCTEEAKAAAATPPLKKSCFAHHMNESALQLTPAWQLCAIYFTDLVAPPWGQDMLWDPTKVIKFQIDMQQPGDGAPDIPFDVWVDEVRWIIPGESTAHAGVPATSGCVPAPAPAG